MGLGRIFLTRVGSGPKISTFFPPGQKNISGSHQKILRSKMGRPLIYCGPKVCLVGYYEKTIFLSLARPGAAKLPPFFNDFILFCHFLSYFAIFYCIVFPVPMTRLRDRTDISGFIYVNTCSYQE